MANGPWRSPTRKQSFPAIFVLRRKYVLLAVGVLLMATAYGLYARQQHAAAVTGTVGEERTIHMVTGEFKATKPDGTVLEAYRWDPGTVFVRKGERVKLTINGINGVSHPFIVEGLGLKGEVKQGQETSVSFKADKPGIYRIICLTHPDAAHNGPMIGYIVVQ
ncbi:cupredoxin domain-containing protein [Paenibacillus hodogayensis]|uniref:Cupredoxin domain-containing protein n=1 Tax=Paenibacillus hodogayensis TaxID=279208 RepID=A0ABV5VZV6_9BACL